MTIRIVIQTCDAEMSANVGGPVHSTFRTIDIENADLEQFLSCKMGTYEHRQVIGVEVIAGMP